MDHFENGRADAGAVLHGQALELVTEGRERCVRQVELISIERQACQVAHRSKLAHEVGVDVQLAMSQVDREDLVFGGLEEMRHAVGKIMCPKRSV